MKQLEYNLRPMQNHDVTSIVSLWNSLYTYDRRELPQIISVLRDTEGVSQSQTLLAVDSKARIVGFVLLAIGQPENTKIVAYLRAIAAAPEKIQVVFPVFMEYLEGIVPQYCVDSIECCRFNRGAYLFPGIDVRYQSVIAALKTTGFVEAEQLFDVEHLHLLQFIPNEFQQETLKTLQNAGIVITPYKADAELLMETFIQRSGVDYWFSRGWREELVRIRTLIAHNDISILGYAQYRPSGNHADFGPVAVLPDWRQQGIGTSLLLYAMQDMKMNNVRQAGAHWVWPLEYYLRNSWEVAREYVALRKQLSL